MRKILLGLLFILVLLPLSGRTVRAEEVSGVVIGEHLAMLLRAGRSVISGHQELINDPAPGAALQAGSKGLVGDRIVDETIALYVARSGEQPITDDMSELGRRLTEAQIESIREVVNEHQDEINAPGVGFKGFIPAVFARLVNERFAEKVGGEARVKVTAPVDLVRNRKARPDKWERIVIQDQFLSRDWPKGDAFTEDVQTEGRSAFRMLLPEYYSASCLACHGGPAGEVDITGYPKEGGDEGDLAGAISITLFK